VHDRIGQSEAFPHAPAEHRGQCRPHPIGGDGARVLLDTTQPLGNRALVDRIKGQREEGFRVHAQMPRDFSKAARSQVSLLLLEIALCKGAECMRGPLDPKPSIEGGVLTELDLGVILAGDVPGSCGFDC
jgi:hypothetical protein